MRKVVKIWKKSMWFIFYNDQIRIISKNPISEKKHGLVSIDDFRDYIRKGRYELCDDVMSNDEGLKRIRYILGWNVGMYYLSRIWKDTSDTEIKEFVELPIVL